MPKTVTDDSDVVSQPDTLACRLSCDHTVMLLSFTSSFQQWFYQVKSILIHKANHLTPQDVCIIMVFAISIGYCMLKGKV